MATCCMAEKYGGWCKEQFLEERAIDGKNYCIFHSPKPAEVSKREIEQFNQQVFEHIQEAIDDNEACDFSGTIFPGPISFRYGKVNLFPPINFRETTFVGKVNFYNCTFRGGTNFRGSTFNGDANFGRSTFSGDADFEGSTFNGDATFPLSTFHDSANFMRSTFSGNAEFVNCRFSNVAFGGSTFNGDANFGGSTFIHGGLFSRSTFNGFAGFINSTFNGFAGFISSTFNGDATFKISTFSGKTDFSESTFSTVQFYKTNFQSHTSFKQISLIDDSQTVFTEVDFSDIPISFLETDLTDFRFDRCRWPQKKDILAYFGSDVLYDEIKADEVFRQTTFKDKLFNFSEVSSRYSMVGELYRQLKQQYKERHNESEASKWHFREKEMFRKEKLLRRWFGISAMYWLSSGYGERPFRAWGMLIFLLGFLVVVANTFGLEANTANEFNIELIKGWEGTIDWTKTGLLIQAVIQHALFAKKASFVAATSAGNTALLIFTRLLIPIQAALFAFALRNKFRR